MTDPPWLKEARRGNRKVWELALRIGDDPDKGASASPDSHTKQSFDQGFTGQQPRLGEEGSGQSRSTTERSGGQQGRQSQRQSQGSSDTSGGKTAQAMEEQQQHR